VPAAFGVVLAAIYLLWAYQRVFHGPITSEENRRLTDLNLRELAMLAPIMALIIFIGVYPKPFLDRIEPAADRIVQQLNDGSVLPDAGVAEGP
jgi:NADH-quinone oxidoreductase subunit M